jgi:hypothetical protein
MTDDEFHALQEFFDECQKTGIFDGGKWKDIVGGTIQKLQMRARETREFFAASAKWIHVSVAYLRELSRPSLWQNGAIPVMPDRPQPVE